MKKIGIIAAMEEEIRVLKQSIEEVNETEIAGSVFYAGVYQNRELVLVQSGIGKVNAAVAAVLLIQHFHCDAVINTGSGGGVGKGLHVGDVVLSTTLSYFDADSRVFGYQMGQIPQMPAAYEASVKLIKMVEKAAETANLTVKKGEILTGDSFVSGGEIIESVKRYFPAAQIVEMEGAAVAQTCWKFGVPFLIVRAVSDTADSEAAVSFDEFIIEAGRKSAEMVLGFLRMV